MQEAQITRRKISRFDYNKISNFYLTKEAIDKFPDIMISCKSIK